MFSAWGRRMIAEQGVEVKLERSGEAICEWRVP
jgi:hypothetical protein